MSLNIILNMINVNQHIHTAFTCIIYDNTPNQFISRDDVYELLNIDFGLWRLNTSIANSIKNNVQRSG